MGSSAERGKGVVLTGVLNDIHSLGLYVCEQALQRAGFRVVKLGTNVTQEDFIQGARETAADVLFVSSSNGAAQLDFEGFREKCKEAGLKDVLIYAGGMLTLRSDEWDTVKEKLTEFGVNRVFPPGTPLSTIFSTLEADLRSGSKTQRKEE